MTDTAPAKQRATFNSMMEGTQEDWDRIAVTQLDFYGGLSDRVLSHLRLLGGDFGGFKVDRLTHSLQTATRAYRANRDDEYVACALLHDIGDTLACYNHPDIGAAIVRPFVSEGYHWMVEKHGIFQGYYFFHYLGLDRNMREQFRGHPNFERTAMFCARHDQNAFDPGYDTMPLEAFMPMVHRVMERPKRSIYLREDRTTPLAAE